MPPQSYTTTSLLLLFLLLAPPFCLSSQQGGDSAASPENLSETPQEEDEGPIKPVGTGVGLGEILGVLFLVSSILYCLGMVFKIFKIIKGTYVEEEPVFLKYK